MYQTVGHMGIEILAKAMGLPLYRQETKGKSTQTGKHYVPTDNDEVEDLYNLLATCKVSSINKKCWLRGICNKYVYAPCN